MTTTNAKPVAATPAAPIAAAIAEQDERLAAGAFTMLGQVDIIHTDNRGSLDFRKAGPLLASASDRMELLLASEVTPPAPLRRLLNEPCAHCSETCRQCDGSKAANCYSCGGTGLRNRDVNCDCMAGGALARYDCADCRGSGRKPSPVPCPGCAGIGKVSCPNCFGTGLAGRGCEQCEGQGRKIELTPQPLEQFVHGQIEGRVAIGPIRSIVFHTLDGSGRIEIIDFRPDRNQNLSVLLLELGDAAGMAKGHLIGGLPIVRPRRGMR